MAVHKGGDARGRRRLSQNGVLMTQGYGWRRQDICLQMSREAIEQRSVVGDHSGCIGGGEELGNVVDIKQCTGLVCCVVASLSPMYVPACMRGPGGETKANVVSRHTTLWVDAKFVA